MPPSKHCCRLACEVALEHFGENVEAVCKSLINGGLLSLPQLASLNLEVEGTKLTPTSIRNCLLVLVQHNCVQPFRYSAQKDTQDEAPKSQTQYAVLINNILHRLRFPKFVRYARDYVNQDAAALVEGLLEHGRLSLDQMRQRAVNLSNSQQSEGLSDGVDSALVSLVAERFVERCPDPEPIIPPKQISDAARKALKGGLRTRATVAAEKYFDAEEDRIVHNSYGSKDSVRFSVPSCVSLNVAAAMDVDSAAAGNLDTGAAAPITGVKRKREADDAQVGTVLWRVNFEEFLRRFRHKVCVSYIRERYDLTCSSVVSAWLHFDRSKETCLSYPFTSFQTPTAVHEIVREAPEGSGLTFDRIRTSLKQMSADSLGVVQRSTDVPPLYSINMKKIIDLAQMREVEAIINQRFGSSACRIFRLLLLKRQLEQKQIGELSMMPINETRETLYKMLKDGYVVLQELAKTADHAPTRTFYLWRVHLPGVLKTVLDHLCKAASNLRLRLKFEADKEQEFLALLEQHNISGGGSVPPLQLTEAQRNQLTRLNAVANVLEASLLRLDDVILLFSCY